MKSLAITPDGKRILTAGGDASIRLFEVATGKLERSMRIPDGLVESPFRSVAITANGERAIAGNAKGYVSLWDLKNGKQINLFSDHKGEVTALALLPDGKQFVSAADNAGAIKQVDMAAGKVTRTFEGHTKGVTSLAVSADGKRLVSSSADTTVRLWDLKTGKEIAKLAEHTKAVTQAVFLNNERVASTVEDGAMIVWHLPK